MDFFATGFMIGGTIIGCLALIAGGAVMVGAWDRLPTGARLKPPEPETFSSELFVHDGVHCNCLCYHYQDAGAQWGGKYCAFKDKLLGYPPLATCSDDPYPFYTFLIIEAGGTPDNFRPVLSPFNKDHLIVETE